MQYALVNNERSTALPGLTGICPACGSETIAKCGTQRVHHWAHRGSRTCDTWSEPETLWPRAWKEKFPNAWREFIRHDQSGEKHIADVYTGNGLTIEFQHSHLKPQERAAREAFYGNMVWIVDGSRLKRDLPRFADGSSDFARTPLGGIYTTGFPEEAFPRNWITSQAPVLFDFQDAIVPLATSKRIVDPLWCLLPGRVLGKAIVLAVSREDFLERANRESQPIQAEAISRNVSYLLAEQARLNQDAQMRALAIQNQPWRRKGVRRRYPRF